MLLSMARLREPLSSGERREGAGQPPPDFVGDGLEFGPPGEGDHDLRVECLDDRAGAGRADDDITRQQQADAAVDGQRLAGGWRIAGAEDDVILHRLAQLGPHGRGDVDLGEHAEALLAQGRANPAEGVGEGHVQGDAGAVAHRAASSVCCRATWLRISSMFRSRTAWMTCSSAGAGSAPGWEKTRMPSRNAIRVGMVWT